MNNEEKYSLCALNRIFGFEPKIGHALITNIGSAADIFRLTDKEQDRLLGPWSKYKGRICRKAVDLAAEELELLSRQGISFLGCTEEGYPDLLLECEDPSLGLYIRSATPAGKLFISRKRIAVVGTRDISPYGQEWCSRIVQELGKTREKPVIVSGLALGTDICAHHNAVESGLPTIAVMATGPETVYPHRHRAFAERLAATEGCALITDYPPGTAPLAIHFLRRNRIIAGLSDSTVLIESRIKGGGMMTCRLAFSYNREVYALPGRIDDPRSQGCNHLIREKMAEAIESADSLIDSLRLKSVGTRSRGISSAEIIRELLGESLDARTISELAVLLDHIRKNRGITVDELSAAVGSSYSRIRQLTGLLEMESIISIDLMQRCTVNTRIYR